MKKGFTLTEVLAVITLIGIIGTLFYAATNKQVAKYEEELLKNQEDNIVLAAKLWGSDNEELLPTDVDNETMATYEEVITKTVTDYGIIKITYGNLITEEYIDQAINPVTKEEIKDDEYYILIKKADNKWSYELVKS